jgi:hypothetical protein
MWRLPGDAAIGLAPEAGFEVESGGRYVWRRYKAATLPAGETVIRLEAAVSCRVVCPPEVVRLDVLQGGGVAPLFGSQAVPTGPGQFEIRGLRAGARVGIVGRCGQPSTPCTERLEFTAAAGYVARLEPR